MRVHVLQHAEGEGLGSLKQWFDEHQAAITLTRVDLHEPMPSVDSFDWLVILGGPMGAYEESHYPWLVQEKTFIRETIQAHKLTLGICLGGQLIASAMGAKIYPNAEQEIGWFPIEKTHSVATWLPNKATLLCWHGDVFELPDAATGFSRSAITRNQGFCIGPRVWALQFHVEALSGTTETFFKVTGEHLPAGDYVQSLDSLSTEDHLYTSQQTAFRLLDFMLDHLS